MSNNSLTGSEDSRILQIQNQWLVFEPISDERYALNENLYTNPLGQTFESEVVINSGSVKSVTGSIDIEKDIHVFEDENDAAEFLTLVGPENIISYSELEVEDPVLGSTKKIEIHTVNYPVINFEFNLLYTTNEKGFIVEPFISGSSFEGGRIDLEPVYKKIILNQQDQIVSDTYLRYFCFACADFESNIEDTSVSSNEETADPLSDEGAL